MITIAEKRRNMNLSQEQLAVLLGVDRTTVSKWEIGEAKPRVETLVKLAKIFCCTVDELVRSK